MEIDWKIIDWIANEFVSQSVFRIFKIYSEANNMIAYAVYDGDTAVSIFTDMHDAYEDMYKRMRRRKIALDSSYTFDD